MIMSGNLRTDYIVLHRLTESYKEMGITKEVMLALAKPIKERIRNTIHEQLRSVEEGHVEWHYNIYDDQRWCKFIYDQLPEEWQDDMTREEAIEEYKKWEWHHWYNPWDDGRDCTGVWFTNWIAVFPIPELHKTIVYHSQSCDV